MVKRTRFTEEEMERQINKVFVSAVQYEQAKKARQFALDYPELAKYSIAEYDRNIWMAFAEAQQELDKLDAMCIVMDHILV